MLWRLEYDIGILHIDTFCGVSMQGQYILEHIEYILIALKGKCHMVTF